MDARYDAAYWQLVLVHMNMLVFVICVTLSVAQVFSKELRCAVKCVSIIKMWQHQLHRITVPMIVCKGSGDPSTMTSRKNKEYVHCEHIEPSWRQTSNNVRTRILYKLAWRDRTS